METVIVLWFAGISTQKFPNIIESGTKALQNRLTFSHKTPAKAFLVSDLSSRNPCRIIYCGMAITFAI